MKTEAPGAAGLGQLNEAIRAALGGASHDEDALARAMSEELGAASSSEELSAAVAHRLQCIREVRALMTRETESQGDNVKPLADLDPNDSTVWVMLRLAHRIMGQLRELRAAGSAEALVVGIVAPAGGGKSTFVQVLKLLLRSVCCAGDAFRPRCEEVSLDDFLTSQQERTARGIANRWELNSTAEYFAETVLARLKHGKIDGKVDVPCFSKGLDDRMDTVRELRGQVDIVLFEGWRVGVAHPNFFPFNRVVDTLVFLEVDFDAILETKFECVQRDIEACGYDMYEQHGGYEHVFDRHYRRMYYDWILPVKTFADVVISKDTDHQFCGLEIRPGCWATARDVMQVEDTETVVVGAGQAGLCAAFYLQQAGSSYVALEKAEEVGTTWTKNRWDSFRLVTENSLCMMPDFPCTEVDEDPRGFMPRDKIAAYLQAFCKAKNLRVRLGEGVAAVTKGWQGVWIVQTTTGNWLRSPNVIMACSGFHRPSVPAFAKELPPEIQQLHSSDYKNPQQLAEGACLVVGTGQSGTQIATELAESGSRVYACVGSRSLRVPRRVRGKDFTWWLWKTGLYDTKTADLPVDAQKAKRFGPNPSQCPGRDVSFRDLCHKHDLTLLGKARGVKDSDVLQLESSTLQLNMTRIEANVQRMQLFIEQYIQTQQGAKDPELQDLEPLELESDLPLPTCETSPIAELSLKAAGVTSVIHCTGYKLNFQAMIDLPSDTDLDNAAPLYSGETGYPIQERGAATHHPGLFFLGLSWMYKWKSAVLCGIAEDAEHVVRLATDRSAKHQLTALSTTRPLNPGVRASVQKGIDSDSAAADSAESEALKVPLDQLTARDAWQQPWQCHYDLMKASSDRVFLREVGGTRKPLDYARLKSFIAEDLELHKFGIAQGDRLCVVIPNGPEAAVCFLGMSLFCTFAPLSTKLSAAAFKFEFEDLPAKAVVVLSGLPDSNSILQEAASCGNLPIIELVPSTDDVGLFSLQWRSGSAQLSPLIAGRVWPKRDDVALVLHTSGTTNKPKVVPLTHGNISCGALCIASTLDLTRDDICINIMPLFHIHGIAVNVLVTALSGSSVYATTGYAGGETFFASLQESPPPTWYSAVPTMHQDILNFAEEYQAQHGAAPEHCLKFARNCSAALLPSVGERMESVMGVEVLCTYAMTESMPIATNPRRGAQRKLRSVGFSGGPDILVMRDPEYSVNTEICQPGEEGHICVRGECVTHGYEIKGHMTEDPNIKAFTSDGFLCTGDKGFIDSDGHLVLSGRFKEIINRGGEKISPMEVEDVLNLHPAIREIICFSAPHMALGEVVGAAVVLHPGEVLALEKLRSFALKNGLSPQWLPETMVLMSTIPKGSTGKPARIGLAAKLQLPEMKDGDTPTCWDVIDARVALSQQPVPAAEPNAEAEHPLPDSRKLHDSFLAVERSPVQLKGSTKAVRLNRETWAATLLSFLMPALSTEIASILGLPREDVSDEIPLCNLSFDSLSLCRFQRQIRSAIGMQVPLVTLMGHTITSLSNEIIAGGFLVGDKPFSKANGLPPESCDVKQLQRIDENAAFELLPMQQLYWTGRSQLVTGGAPQPAWIEWETMLPNLDKMRFEMAVNALIVRHGALRTFVMPDGKQQIEPADHHRSFDLAVTDAENDEAVAGMRNLILSNFGLAQRPFQIEALREGAGSFRVLFVFDLMVVDARALTVFVDELWKLYSESTAMLPDLSLSMPVYVALDTQRRSNGEQRRRENEFWGKLCDQDPEDGGLHPHPQLPLAANQELGHISRLSSSISAEKWQQIRKLCLAEGLTESSLLFACYTSVLGTWSSSKQFTMNAALFGRDAALHTESSSLVGNLSSTTLVPVDVRLGAAPSLRSLAKALQHSMLTAMEHSECTSGTDVMARLNKRDNAIGRAVAPFVFASVLNQQPSDTANPFTWFGRTPEHAALTTPQVWLDVQVFDDVDGSLFFNWDAHLERFPQGLVLTLFRAFCSLLEDLAVGSDGPSAHHALSRRPVLSPDQEQMVHRLNDAAQRPELQPQLMHQAILRQALATPHAIAVRDASTGIAYTFERIVQLARSFATAIVEAEAAAASAATPTRMRPVPVYMKKGWQQVVGVLAAQLAGCAYVPISANQPAERITGILVDINARVLLHDRRVDIDALNLSTACGGGLSALCVVPVAEDAPEAQLPAVSDAEGQVQLHDLAYIIFTSGSTGKPKGVMIPHSGGSNTCQDMNERFGVTANDSVLSLAALSFDLSVYDIFGVMATGGTLVMPDHRHKQDPEHWLELMETHNITVWNTAPPVMTMLLDYVASSFEARERFSRLAIRLVFLSGDFIPLSMASTLKQLLPDPHLRVYSLGGATEASIWSCYYPIEDVSSSWKSVPYGRALGNQKLFVLDADLQPVQDLVHGEICIAGAGLARGYWADEEKTGRAFVHSPALGERIYRTGDLGRFYPTGDVEILGRIDFQVKVNGFRVEIGEVEAAIKAVDRVKSAIAMPVGEKGMQQLACFIVCTDPEAAVDEAQKMEVLDSVHKGLQTRVPSYAIPKHMILLQQWPVSVSGKVDRQALKRHLTEHLEAHLQQGGAGAGPQHIEPRNETETRLRDIWEAVLGFSGFGVMDSFLDIGGSSINLLRMAYSVKDEFGQSVPMDVLAGCSSIAALASWLQRTDSVSQSLAGNSFSKVVPFNATGSMPPCFFVAPVSGSSLCYRRLADALGTEQPIIALSHTQVCQDVEQPSLEDIAADLVRAVLEHLDTLPEGRREAFSLGGWSMGGVLAFEMLFQLRKKGKRLAKVILVDSPAPAEGIAVIEDEALSLVQFANDLTALDHAAELPSATLLGLSDAPLQDMLIALQRLSAMPDAMSLAEFAADFDIYQRNLRALAAYRPVLESSSGSSPERVLLHLLRASETNAHLQAYPGHRYKDFGWGLIGSINSLSSMLQVQVCLQLYDGDHYTVVREAGAKAIGRIMTPLLADVGTRAVHPPALTNFHFWSGSGGLSRTLSQTRLSQSAQTRAPRPYVDTKDHTSFCVCTGTARSFDDDSVKCAQDAYGELVARSGRMPQLVLVTASPDVDAVQVVHSLQLMAPDARVQAVSSVSGAICNTGRAKLALLGITDPRGRIGLGFAEGASKSEEQARDAGRNAAKQAVQDGLRADKPDVVIVNGTPGHEEQVLAGIADVVGAVGVSVIGGSAAGDLASKSWWVASAHEQRVDISNDGVSVCMLWTSVKTAMVYSSCYEPSKYRGTVTKISSHREIVEIDDQPANMVYREWLQAEADAAVGDSHGDCKHAAALSRLMHEDAASIGEQLFKVSTCRPFGTAAAAPQDSGDASEADFFQLMHPHSISTNGGITLFADVHEGQEVTLMTTSDSDLKRLVEGATGAPAVSDFCETLQGALAFYCAGCSMQIGSEEVDDVAKNLSTSLNGMPFMGVLPFGEQGMDGAGSVRHGNLMYSLLLFGKPKS